VKLHGPAESLQLGTVDAVKPHSELKDCYRKDLSCLQIGAFNERGAILLESGDDRTQMRLGVRDQTQPIVRVSHLHCSPLPSLAVIGTILSPVLHRPIPADFMRQHHIANVNWLTFGKISLKSACTCNAHAPAANHGTPDRCEKPSFRGSDYRLIGTTPV
jgi:hypothetical protein